jgi:predicted metalloendopeptidase
MLDILVPPDGDYLRDEQYENLRNRYRHDVEKLLPLITAATADAKLAGELAARGEATKHCLTRTWFNDEVSQFACSCGLDFNFGEVSIKDQWREHIAALPLTPDSAGVLERIRKEAVQAWKDACGLATPSDLATFLGSWTNALKEPSLERIKKNVEAEAYARVYRECPGLEVAGARKLEEWIRKARAAEQAAIADSIESAKGGRR